MWNARVQTSTQDYRPYVRLLAGEGPNLCELCEISYTNSCCDKKFKLLTPVLIIGADSASKDPVLFIWDKFADCYKLKSNTSITIEKIDRKSVICQKVIFAVKNYQTADVLSKSLTEFDELLESGPLLVRKNDWFWWKPELFKSVAIVSSEPTNQGIINSSTSAAVTLVPDLLNCVDDFVSGSNIRPKSKVNLRFSNLRFVSVFLLQRRRRRFRFRLFFESVYKNLSVRPKLNWPQILCPCLAKFRQETDDFNSLIFIHPYLAALTGAKNGCYQLVSVISSEGKTLEERLVKVHTIKFCCVMCSLRSDWDWAEEILVNPTLQFNLSYPKTMRFGATKTSYEMRLAKEVKISLVNSPNYAFDVNCDNILRQYFDESKIMKLNDVFSVALHQQDNGDNPAKETDVIYFKIVEMNVYDNARLGKRGVEYGMIVNCETSTMIQVGNVGSFIPRFPSNRSLEYVALKNYLDVVYPLAKVTFTSKQIDKKPACFLFYGPPGCGKAALAKLIASLNSMHYFELDCFELWSEVAGSAEAKLKNVFHKASLYAPVVLCLKNLEIIGRDAHSEEFDARVLSYFATNLQQTSSDGKPVVVIGTTRHLNILSQTILSCFLYQFKIDTLKDEERKLVLQHIIQSEPVFARNIDVFDVNQRTAFSFALKGFGLADFYQLAADAKYLALQRVSEKDKSLIDDRKMLQLFGYSVETDDVLNALHDLQSSVSNSLGAPKVPDVKWEDVGGLADVKEIIYDTIQLSLEHPELFSMGMRRSGVLLYGPPGCGKTLLAKAVATECSLNFISVKGPELLNMYVGQSEQNVRELFERARGAAPCVIFFDELDALAPNRGRSGDSGGVMDRVVSQLLAELDGIQSKGSVFVIGATNRPDLLDPSLLRPGRFDKILYVGIGDDDGARLNVLAAVTRKLTLDPTVDLMQIVRHCPDNMSGADFYALAAEAATNAAGRIIELIENSSMTMDESNCPPVVVTTADFLTALKHLTPSVPLEDLIKYKELRRKM